MLLLQKILSFILLILNANRGTAAVSTLNKYSGYLCSRGPCQIIFHPGDAWLELSRSCELQHASIFGWTLAVPDQFQG